MRTLEITLPGLHPGQAKVDREIRRYNALACGRRWGKSKYLTRRMAQIALAGQRYGYFGANYKLLTEVWHELRGRLSPAITSANKTENRIELLTGGVIEFWTLENKDAGRSRKYHEVGIDEAGLVPDLENLWFAAIRPTLTDYQGRAVMAGTPKGRNYFATAYALGQDPENQDWASWQMPTSMNPTIPNLAAELAQAKGEMPERLYQQEYEAIFLDEAGGVFHGVRDVVEPRKTYDGSSPFYIGVDLAKHEDFTVICVVDSQGNQCGFERFNQISWERQISRIKETCKSYPGAVLTVDSTGVGDPIYERLRNEVPNVSPKGYNLTAGSKEALIDNLAMLIEKRGVRLLDIPEQTNELLAYQYELTPSRNVRMNAPQGMHDDTVIALALACWPLRDNSRKQNALL